MPQFLKQSLIVIKYTICINHFLINFYFIFFNLQYVKKIMQPNFPQVSTQSRAHTVIIKITEQTSGKNVLIVPIIKSAQLKNLHFFVIAEWPLWVFVAFW